MVKLHDIKSTHKGIAFVYTNNFMAEKGFIWSVPFIITVKKIQYHGIN